MEGVLDLRNEAISEKNPQIFLPLLSAEYVTVFSGRTDAPEVKCDLTDTHTHTQRQTNYSNPPVHAWRGLKINSTEVQTFGTQLQHDETCTTTSFIYYEY